MVIDVVFGGPGQPPSMHLKDEFHNLRNNGQIPVEVFTVMVHFNNLSIIFILPSPKAKINHHVPAGPSQANVSKTFALVEPLGFTRLFVRVIGKDHADAQRSGYAGRNDIAFLVKMSIAHHEIADKGKDAEQFHEFFTAVKRCQIIGTDRRSSIIIRHSETVIKEIIL